MSGLLGVVVGAVIENAYLGGELQAAFRQGFNELGAFFGKPLPDSIQVDEPGAAFNPLYRDRAGDSKPDNDGGNQAAPSLPSPGEIAKQGKPDVTVHGDTRQAGKENLPSPSQIAKDQRPQPPDQGHGQDQGKDRGRGM